MIKETACALLLLSTLAAAQSPIRLNEIQVIGSHNSYHERLAPGEFASLKKRDPRLAASLDYRHRPLDQQLSSGVRQFELDVWADSRGGLFAAPAGLRLVKEDGFPPDPPFDPAGLMRKPGLKVLHMQDVDYRSTCLTFVACLETVQRWSRAHPGHLPIFIMVENKDERPRPELQVQPELLTPAIFDTLEAEIRSVFPREAMLTPDDVRGRRASLREAIQKDGWPALDRVRGKVVFLLDQRRATALYLRDHPALRGRLMFPNAEPGSPEGAFTLVNEPFEDRALIPRLVREGYLVRTRTDANLEEPRVNDVRRRDFTLASGAQILSTDYAFDERHPVTGYSVSFPEGTAVRCNPVLKPAGCDPHKLEVMK